MQPGKDFQAGETAPPLSRVPGYSCGLMRFPGFEGKVPTSNFIWAHTGGFAGHGSIFVYDIKNNFVLGTQQEINNRLLPKARDIDEPVF